MPRARTKPNKARRNDDADVTALVIPRSASGKRFDGHTQITAANVSDYQPSAHDVAASAAGFTRLGFAVGPLVGISFAISGARTLFESVFAVKIDVDARGACTVRNSKGDAAQLPLGYLPRELRELLLTVTFSPPADLYLDARMP
jgi:hypothetical protein